MGIFKNYRIKHARQLGERLGRDGVTKNVIEAIQNWDGSHKGAMKLCGELSFWADVATFDLYWQEQVQRGMNRATEKGCSLMEQYNFSECELIAVPKKGVEHE